MKRAFIDLFGPAAVAAFALNSGVFFEAQAFPFPTDGPALFISTPQNGETGVAVNSAVSFFFTETMAPTHSIEWSANVNPANLTYAWMVEGQMLNVTARGGFPANATITWKLNPTANDPANFKSAEGTPLPVGTFQGSFTTAAGGDHTDPCDPNGGDTGLGFGSIYKTVNYTQTGNQAPVLKAESPARFGASYRGASNQTITAVTVAGPGTTLNLTNVFNFFIGSRDFATPEALDAALPAGNYTVTASGAGNGSVTIGSTSEILAPRFNSLIDLVTMDATQNFTLTFAPFAGAGLNDAIFISISAVDDTNEFHAPDICRNIALPNTASSVVIPANTFKRGQHLRGSISFSRSSFNTNSIPSTSLSGGVQKTTEFDITLGGGQEPRAPMWTTVTRNPDGTLSYTISGDTGLNIGIEASESLTGGWTQLTTSVLVTGSFEFTVNPNTPNKRFYRARVL
jgi:hypothetical protein